MKKASLGVRPQSVQWSGAIPTIMCAVRLEIVNANLAPFVQVPSRLCECRFRVASTAGSLTAK